MYRSDRCRAQGAQRRPYCGVRREWVLPRATMVCPPIAAGVCVWWWWWGVRGTTAPLIPGVHTNTHGTPARAPICRGARRTSPEPTARVGHAGANRRATLTDDRPGSLPRRRARAVHRPSAPAGAHRPHARPHGLVCVLCARTRLLLGGNSCVPSGSLGVGVHWSPGKSCEACGCSAPTKQVVCKAAMV